MEKDNLYKEMIVVFWIFIIGSLAGYFYEMIIVLFKKGFFESRQGLIYGPFSPVYGIGAIVYYMILKNRKDDNKIKVFLITMLLGGVTEYLCSFAQEKLFGTISWDYSYLPFNLNGRTSLLHCTYWGIGGVIYTTWIRPLLEKIGEKSTKKSLRYLTLVFSFFMVFNIAISCLSANRQQERNMNIPAQDKIDVILDKYYPDEYMNKVFANKKEVVNMNN